MIDSVFLIVKLFLVVMANFCLSMILLSTILTVLIIFIVAPLKENHLPLVTVEKQIIEDKYFLAFSESDGFFTDITDSDWKMMKKRQRESKYCPNNKCGKEPPQAWYQKNFDPTFTCPHERKLGPGGLGVNAKWVCDPHRISRENCLVYSIGSSNEFSFENEVFQQISNSCEIHTFDPSVGKNPSNRPKAVKFHP